MLDSRGALADTPPPKRFLVALAGSSLGAYGDPIHNLFVPDRVGADYDLKTALVPLGGFNSVKNEISVVSGLRIPWARENGGTVPPGGRTDGFHAGVPSPLVSGVRSIDGYPSDAANSVFGETSDQIAGRILGPGTPFPVLPICVQAD